MRIAHIANMYGPKSGGLRTTIDALAEIYSDRGHSVMTIVPGKQAIRREKKGRIEIIVPGVKIPFSGGYRVILRTGIVRKYLQEFNPEILEISDRTTLLKVSRWARSKSIQTNFFAHERIDGVLKAFFPNLPGRKILAKVWNQRTFNSVDRIIATTVYASEEFVSLDSDSSDKSGSKLFKVPLGVDLIQFNLHHGSEKVSEEPEIKGRYFFACTRLSKEKDPNFLISIAQEIKKQDINYQIVVAGDGPLRAALEKEVRDQKLPISFLGFIADKARVAKLMAHAECFFAVGPIETFGLAALESLASGTPVICRDTAAITEVIADGCGVSSARIASLWITEATKFIEKDRSFNAKIARERAEYFSWDRCADSLLQLHGEAV